MSTDTSPCGSRAAEDAASPSLILCAELSSAHVNGAVPQLFQLCCLSGKCLNISIFPKYIFHQNWKGEKKFKSHENTEIHIRARTKAASEHWEEDTPMGPRDRSPCLWGFAGLWCSANPRFHPVMGGEACGVPGGQFAVLSPEDIHTSRGTGTKVEPGSACVPDNAVTPQKPGLSQRAQQRPRGEGDMSEPPSRWEKQDCDAQEGRVSMRPSPDGPGTVLCHSSAATGSCGKTPRVQTGRKSSKLKMKINNFLKN